MNRSAWHLVLLLVAAAALAALVWLVRPGGAAPAPSKTAGTGTAPTGQGDEQAIAAGDDRDRTPVAADARPPADASPAIPAGGPRVLVVRHDRGTPVAGAVVRALQRSAVPPERAGLPFRWWRLVDELGVETRTDDQGIAVLPRLELRRFDNVWVTATSGEAFGVSRLRDGTDPGPHRLEIRREARLRIRAVDPRGQPAAGVPIALGGYFGPLTTLDVWREATDRNGRAEVPHLRAFLALEKRRERRDTVWVVRPAFPCSPASELPVDPHAPPAEPITFVVPDTGRLVVEARDPLGRPPPGRLEIHLQIADPPRPVLGFVRGGEGEVVYDRVEVGVRYQAVGLRTNLAGEYQGEGPGPLRRGDEGRLVISLPDIDTILEAQLLDARGRPLDGCEVFVVDRRWGPKGRHDQKRRDTDENGRLRVELTRAGNPEQRRTVFLFACDAADRPDGTAVRVELPAELDPARHDVGTLVLEQAPLVVGGRLLDARGHPFDGDVGGYIVASSYTDERERPPDVVERAVVLVRGDEGGFEVRGFLVSEHATLSVNTSSHGRALLVPFRPGETGLDVVLERRSR